MAVHRGPGILSDEEGGIERSSPGGVAWLATPSPGGLGLPGTDALALERHLDEVEAGVAAGDIRALAVRLLPRAEVDDLRALLAVSSEGDAIADALAGQAALRRLEQLPVPSVAVLDGPTFGPELELALACSYRIASASALLALPQLRAGLIPALGGTVRLPRLIGLEAAVRLILRGETLGAGAARALGLVDRVLAPVELVDGVERFALERVERGRIRTGARRRMHRRLVEDTAPGRRLLFARAAREAAAGAAPPSAVRAALRSIADGVSLPLERAFEREAELYGQLVASEAAKSLLHAALLEAEASHPHPAGAAEIERVGVLGAHEEGLELAALLARRGRSVRLKDRDRGALATSVHRLRERLDARDGDGRSREERVEGTVGFGGFGVLDLVVAEAEPSADATIRALAEAEEHVADRCLLAAGSPVLPLASLQAALREPSRALGIVAPRPGELFPVLEIVSGPATLPGTLATACRLARSLGRVPLHVADGPGFLVHRLLAVYLVEATRIVHEGTGVEALDEEMEEFGFALGPLRRIDAMGIDAVSRLVSALAPSLGQRVAPTPVMRWMADRRARFYRYRRGRPVGVNPALPAGNGAAPPATGEQIRERLVLALVNEGARVLEEGVAASAADVDLGAMLGLGYPRRRGGLLYQADRRGLRNAEEALRLLAERHGESYRPAALLDRLAEAGEGFYAARPLASGHAPG